MATEMTEITTESEYECARVLARAIMQTLVPTDCAPGTRPMTRAEKGLSHLVDMLVVYEKIHFPIDSKPTRGKEVAGG